MKMDWVKRKMDYINNIYNMQDFKREFKAISHIVKKLDKYTPTDPSLHDEQMEAAKEASELLIQASHIIASL